MLKLCCSPYYDACNFKIWYTSCFSKCAISYNSRKFYFVSNLVSICLYFVTRIFGHSQMIQTSYITYAFLKNDACNMFLY